MSCVHHCSYSIIIAVNEFFGATECCNESYNIIIIRPELQLYIDENVIEMLIDDYE